MPDVWLPAAATLFLWWFATGAILYLDGLPRRTHGWTLGCATLLLAASLLGLVRTRGDDGAAAAYAAFVCALGVWSWQELAFLLGAVTGPRCVACPPGVTLWQRAGLALQTVAYHELALVLLALAVIVCVGDGANRVGWWTFAALWAMRQSAKLNLLFGVRNLGEALLPAHLSYLASYFRRAPANWLWPLSIAANTVAAAWVWSSALDAAPGSTTAVGGALVGTLLLLGLVEHLLLVVPVPVEALWRWGLRSRSVA